MVVRQNVPVENDETGDAVTEWQLRKEEGNKLFMDGHHLKAAAAYTTAIKVSQRYGLKLSSPGSETSL